MRRHADADEVDAVVIGTGAGGAPILHRLAQAGCAVVALEAGRWWTPEIDFATDELEQDKLFWTDERLSAGGDPIAFGANNSGVGVGGSTLHWTAYCPRAQPDDLRLRSMQGVGRDWPIRWEALAPYYDEVERFIGVSGPDPYPWGPERSRAYPLAPLPLNAPARLMAEGCAALGVRTAPAPNAALSGSYYDAAYGWRSACTNRGFCQAGCSHGAKATTLNTFIPAALAAGAEVRDESYVTGFARDGAGRITAVTFVDRDGTERRQRCRQVFLCAGGVESPRMLLLHGLAPDQPVGRGFMAHPGPQVWGVFPEETRPTRGIPGGLISEDTHRLPDADFAGGYLVQSIGVMPVTYATQLGRSGRWGEALVDHMRRFDHVAGINILGECLPDEANRLTLSDEVDARGLPKPLVTFSNGPNERALAAHGERLMRAVWEAAGATEVWSFPRNAHTLGGCRMGVDASDAVVDADGRSWAVPNLHVCDNSVFPSALSVNPCLTQMALSLLIADRFLGRTPA